MIDVHTHLDRVPEVDLPDQVRLARHRGVTDIVTVGMDPLSSQAGVGLACRFPAVYAAVGIHPWEAAAHASTESLTKIADLASLPQVVAIGEIGLDFEGNMFTGESYTPKAARDVQRDVFQQQLALAGKLGLPVVVHARGSVHRDVMTMLDEGGVKVGAVIQLLPGLGKEDVDAYVSRGCYFSVGGLVTDPRESDLRDVAQRIPLECLTFETDAPYVPPVWKGVTPCEPADLPGIALYLAALTGRPVEELLEAAETNARALYRFESHSERTEVQA